MTLTDLTCEYAVNPIGIDVPNPRLSWKLVSDRLGARQTAYRITAGSKPGDHDLWDTEKVDSDQSVHVRYQGTELTTGHQVFWRVTVWDESGEEPATGLGTWEMGLLQGEDWSAKWIQAPLSGGPRSTVPVPYTRSEFKLPSQVAKARLYITALGVYEAYLNGERIGDAELAPGWTDYNARVRYQTYNVTDMLQMGSNCLSALLGDGWYCGHLAWKDRQNYGDRPQLLAQLVVELVDGSVLTFGTDDSWTYSLGSILESDTLMGESQDLRREPIGWKLSGFTGRDWAPVALAPTPKCKLVAQHEPAIKVIEELEPVSVTERPNWPTSRWIVDMGQNMVGRVRLTVRGKAGDTVIIRFAERLNTDGTLYTTNYRNARSTDSFTLAGGGEEVLEPKFTFHGFQYVEIAGLSTVSAEDVKGIVLHSAWEPTGSFECSDPLVNQLQHNIQWGWKGNSVDVPTDCPQRDERLGWTGDAQVFVRTASFNGMVLPFFEKVQQDLVDSQSPEGQIPPVAPFMDITGADGGPAWSDAFVICPWTIYQSFGDRTIIEQHYEPLKRWVDSLSLNSKNLIRSYIGYKGFAGFGDWLSTNADTPIDLIGTAFYAHCARLMSEMATTLGHQEDADKYGQLSNDVRAAFQRRFVTAEGIVAPGTQTAYVLALHFGLLPEELRAGAADALVYDIERRGFKLSTGFVGTPYLNHVLSEAGRIDVAYRLLFQKDWPSWLYSVVQGATTIWERWDGWTHDKGFQDPGMNSFNHYAYGAIGDWLYSTVAGIDSSVDSPGYKKSRLSPRPGGGLTYAEGKLETLYGTLESSWQIEGGKFFWQVTVPPNTEAVAILPPECTGPTLGSAPCSPEVHLTAGSYEFAAVWNTVP